MKDQTKAVLARFIAYATAFETLKTENVTPFFHHPAMLMTSQQVALMNNDDEVKGVFQALFADLKRKNFARSEMNSIQVKQVSENQAIVSGTATRYRQDKSVLEEFGLTYTLRKGDDDWKIICGVLHETVPLMTA